MQGLPSTPIVLQVVFGLVEVDGISSHGGHCFKSLAARAHPFSIADPLAIPSFENPQEACVPLQSAKQKLR